MDAPNFIVDSIETDRSWPGLSAKQAKALVAILAGKSNVEAAKCAGVRPATVSNWVHHNSAFQVHLITARRELYGQILQSLWSEALASVHYLAGIRDSKFADTEQRMKAAQAILKSAAWPRSAVAPVSPSSLQFDMLREMSKAEGDEADNHEIQALNQLAADFDPESKKAEISAYRQKVKDLESRIDELKDAGSEQQRSDLQTELDALRWRLNRREVAYERFETRVHHMCGSFQVLREP